jgi:hypothetical protein
MTLVILYLFSVWYVCKLDSWPHILGAFDFGLKIGCDRSGIRAVLTVGMLAYLEDSYFNGYFQPKLFLLHRSSKPLVC